MFRSLPTTSSRAYRLSLRNFPGQHSHRVPALSCMTVFPKSPPTRILHRQALHTEATKPAKITPMPVASIKMPSTPTSPPGLAHVRKYVHETSQPSNPFSRFLTQSYCIIPSFTLESGVTLKQAPVAYKTFGELSPSGDNVMVVCHALTGGADVGDWWEPLLGPGKALDTSRFFIICLNNLGSPYGSVSPVTTNPESGEPYGPEFPLTTIRDDARIHKLVLDDLGIKQVAVVIGGSLGGMIALEWAYFGVKYVKNVVALATSARNSAWCISWGEAQRQSIYSDPVYDDGYYDPLHQPVAGLAAARMSALLTYRSRNSYESRFGRNAPDPSRITHQSDVRQPSSPSEEHWANHNEGFRAGRKLQSAPGSPVSSKGSNGEYKRRHKSPIFSAQTYLRYHADKFVKRFDANCYIATSRKMDTHDVSRGRADSIPEALAMIEQPTLIAGIESDGLFPFSEQQELAEYIPNAQLSTIYSPEGHDAFLIEFKTVNEAILGFMNEVMPDIMGREVNGAVKDSSNVEACEAKKSSFFGAAEVDIVSW
ncbi:homoserine O- acetyltransferase [Orbilia oligospora]|nr:homoserine O- acetyltransferase [Orbilia oligospora]KAF3247537.1 homoserine O- acetyltransferase [Orbilia oligospora]KAF3250832.1 homoserine O- acetyltransferase [Orbilia oligospora]